MNTKTLSAAALKAIDGYMHFRIGSAVCSVPYFNNKTARARMTLRAKVGKGSASDIQDEIEAVIVKHHIAADTLADESLKKILVDSGLGIDCSGFAYYVLDAESKARGQGHLNRRLNFMKSYSPVGKMMCYLRPAENCNVKTLASDNNSRVISLREAKPGDFVSMIGGPETNERDHILLITAISYDGDMPKSLSYAHAVAYPEDGLYGSGIKQGKIEVAFPDESVMKQVWTEDGSAEKALRIFDRAAASRTEIRRLKWLL